ncbi:MAG: class II aldolase/adducin family protein [Proteobacteria bacterium]|nr:class II aldolase/adducin family protein [Pseudomonadota bacterium]
MTDERSLREDLAALYRIFDHLGWGELIFNHITVKLPGDDGHFLINPYGLLYSEVTASNLVKVDINGNIIEPTDHPVNPAGMLIHSCIHAARHDIVCIAHTHTTAGMTVACQEGGLRPDNFYSTLLHNKVTYHDFEGITVDEAEREQLVANLGDRAMMMILRNHGLLAGGRTIAEAFLNMWILERSCQIQASVDQTGVKQIPVRQEVLERSEKLLAIQGMGQSAGALEFAAMKRLMDKLDPSYRQ